MCADEFKISYKYYKAKNNIPDFSDVVDFHNSENLSEDALPMDLGKISPEMESIKKKLALRDPSDWRVFSLKNHSGLFVICDVFTDLGALFWIQRCLKVFSSAPYINNIQNLKGKSTVEKETWWSKVKQNITEKGFNGTPEAKELRWATLGYHHNWDTKVYSEDERTEMPSEVEELCRLILSVVNPSWDVFKAEAAIVNYYPPGSTLGPHTDHSEKDRDAPLLSFSFGRPAVFLIGGEDRSVKPTALFLRHADVMLMTRSSRLAFHAVPRILGDEDMKALRKTSLNTLESQIEQPEDIHKILGNQSLKEHQNEGLKNNIQSLLEESPKLVLNEDLEANGSCSKFGESVTMDNCENLGSKDCNVQDISHGICDNLNINSGNNMLTNFERFLTKFDSFLSYLKTKDIKNISGVIDYISDEDDCSLLDFNFIKDLKESGDFLNCVFSDCDVHDLQALISYIKHNRINLNVRQVNISEVR